jgi:Suppressor of fused protein (SUFU)
VTAQSASTWPGASAIRAHVERHIGSIDRTFEVAKWLSILHSPPVQTRPLHTLVTCGLSAIAMPPSTDADAPRRLELMATLPESWSLGDSPLQDAERGWPMWLLASLATRLEDAGGRLDWGDVVQNGAPYAPTTKLCAAIIAPSLLVPVGFYELGTGPDRIAFYSAIPLYAEEVELHRARGMQHLFAQLLQRDVNDVIQAKRRNAAKRLFGLF